MEILERKMKEIEEKFNKKYALTQLDRDNLEIERLNRSIDRLTVLRLTNDTDRKFADGLIRLNLNRKLEIQQKIAEANLEKTEKSNETGVRTNSIENSKKPFWEW